jgi:hypothetical protein
MNVAPTPSLELTRPGSAMLVDETLKGEERPPRDVPQKPFQLLYQAFPPVHKLQHKKQQAFDQRRTPSQRSLQPSRSNSSDRIETPPLKKTAGDRQELSVVLAR